MQESPHEKPREPVVRRHKRRKHQSRRKSRPVHHVRQQPYPQIGDRQDQDQAREKQPFHRRLRDPKLQKRRHKQQPRRQLNQRVHRRDWQPARPAFPPQPQPSQNRHVVVRLNRRPALRASRPRRNDRQLLRYPRNADIQEASNHYAQQKKENSDDDHGFSGLSAAALLNLPYSSHRLNQSPFLPCPIPNALFSISLCVLRELGVEILTTTPQR